MPWKRRKSLECAGLLLHQNGSFDRIKAIGERRTRDRGPPRRQATMTERSNDLDRVLRITQSVERHLGHGLEPFVLQRGRQIGKHEMISTSKVQQVSNRETGQRHALRRTSGLPDASARLFN